jgi:hypothetical protein
MVNGRSRRGSALLMAGVAAGLVFVLAGAALMRSSAAVRRVQHEVDRENAGFLAESVLSIGLVKIGSGARTGSFAVQLPTGEGRGWFYGEKGDPELVAWGKAGRVARVYSCKARMDRVSSGPTRQVFSYDWAEIPAADLPLSSNARKVNLHELFKKARVLRTVYVPLGRVRPIPTPDDI